MSQRNNFESNLRNAALRWLELSNGLEDIRLAMEARSQMANPPKVLKLPIRVNVAELNEINAELTTTILTNPLRAQQIFHRAVHAATVASSLDMKSQTHKTWSSDHCPPDTPTKLPDMSDALSLYSEDDALTEKDDRESRLNTVDKVDFDLTMTSLEFDLPIDSSITKDTAEILTTEQVHAPLKVNGIPWGEEWIVGGIRDLPVCLEEPILALVTGRILSLTLPRPYTAWARYMCSTEGCIGMTRDLHLRVFTVGVPEGGAIRPRTLCRLCHSELKEDPSSREQGEKCYVSLLPDTQAGVLTREKHATAQALNIILRDELLVGVMPGQKMRATVMVVPWETFHYPTLEGVLLHPQVSLRLPSSLPPTFRRLVEDRQSSPWSLVSTLAYTFAATVVPAGTFHTLKLALLLSLTSCSSEKAGLAVLTVGSNTTILLKLLWYAARFAPHHVIHSSLDDITASFHKDPGGQIWVRAGSLLLAHGGACVLGEFSKFKKDARHLVCQTLESGMVNVEATPRLRPQTPILKYPLRTAAWACYDPHHAHSRTSADMRDTFLHVPLGDLTKSITDVFGLVVYAETPGGQCESQAEDVITLQILLDATTRESPPAPLLPQDELKQYLAMVRSVEVTFSAGAERMIRGYYVAARRMRGDCVQGAVVPVTAIHTLAQAASCHARLALRITVEAWDAVAAILLCEEGLAAHFGYSLLQVPPTPHLSSNSDLHELVGRKNDERMSKFQQQLEDFIDAHTGDISSTL